MVQVSWLPAAAAIILGWSGPLAAAEPTTDKGSAKLTPEEIVRASTIAIARGPDGSFSGPGWERILSDAREAQFTMIGEQHAVADLAGFETEVFRAIAPYGYGHAALEVGPYSTGYAERLIRSGKGALRDFIAAPGNGFTLPFLFFAEETAMAEVIVARSPDHEQALWGLDQEFVGAIPILARLLDEHATTPHQHELAAALEVRTKADPTLLPGLSDSEVHELAAGFASNPAAAPIVEAIRISREIYQPFVTGTGPYYPANLRRETYMKDNFLRRFNETEHRLGSPPKVFLKFGGYHAMRGMSGTDVPALGNFLAEWGHSRGFRLLNVMADCVNGTSADPRSGKAEPCEPYIGETSTLHRVAAESTDPITLVDLKALRSRLGEMRDLDPKSRQAILAFDYYVAFKDVRASTLLGTAAKH